MDKPASHFEASFKQGVKTAEDAVEARHEENKSLRRKKREEKMSALRDMQDDFLITVDDAFQQQTMVQTEQATHDALNKIFSNEQNVILLGLYHLIFLTFASNAKHNIFKVYDIINARAINRLLYLLKGPDEQVVHASRCLAQLSSRNTQFHKDMIAGGFLQAFLHHVPQNPNGKVKRNMIWALINLMTARDNAEYLLKNGKLHQVFAAFPTDDVECQEYVAWFFNSALTKHKPGFDWREYCLPLWPRVESMVTTSSPQLCDDEHAAPAITDALVGIYHVAHRARVFASLITPKLFSTLLSYASLPLDTCKNDTVMSWIHFSVYILRRCTFEEFPIELCETISKCEPLTHVNLPHMLNNANDRVAQEAAFLVANVTGMQQRPDIAARMLHLVEGVAQRLYDNNSKSQLFNTSAIQILLNVINQLTPTFTVDQYVKLFSSGTIISALCHRLNFPMPETTVSILQSFLYLLAWERKYGGYVIQQMTDRNVIQDVTQLAYNNTNKDISNTAMDVLIVLERAEDHIELTGREMMDQGDEEEEFYYGGQI